MRKAHAPSKLAPKQVEMSSRRTRSSPNKNNNESSSSSDFLKYIKNLVTFTTDASGQYVRVPGNLCLMLTSLCSLRRSHNLCLLMFVEKNAGHSQSSDTNNYSTAATADFSEEDAAVSPLAVKPNKTKVKSKATKKRKSRQPSLDSDTSNDNGKKAVDLFAFSEDNSSLDLEAARDLPPPLKKTAVSSSTAEVVPYEYKDDYEKDNDIYDLDFADVTGVQAGYENVTNMMFSSTKGSELTMIMIVHDVTNMI